MGQARVRLPTSMSHTCPVERKLPRATEAVHVAHPVFVLMLPRRRFLILSAAMAAQAGGVGRAFALEDAVGNTLNLPSTPRRIIAIHPAMVESVVSLGAEDRLVGIGGVVRYPESILSLPRIGGALNFSVEATLALNPDLVVMAMDTDATAQLARPLTAMGVPVFLAKYPDFVSITRYIRLLGAVLDLGDGAERVITAMQAKVAALAERLVGRPVRRIYLETGAAGTGAFQTIRAGHYAEDTIRRAGGLNAFDLRGPPQVTLEGLAAVQPGRDGAAGRAGGTTQGAAARVHVDPRTTPG